MTAAPDLLNRLCGPTSMKPSPSHAKFWERRAAAAALALAALGALSVAQAASAPAPAAAPVARVVVDIG
jgi:hypothetical protein